MGVALWGDEMTADDYRQKTRETAHKLLDMTLDEAERAGVFGRWTVSGIVGNGVIQNDMEGGVNQRIDPSMLV